MFVSAAALAITGACYAFRDTTPSQRSLAYPAAVEPVPAEIKARLEPVSAPLMLDDTIKFSDPANCEANKSTEALFNDVLVPPNGDVANIKAKPIHVGSERLEVQPVLTKALGSTDGEMEYESAADFPQPAAWNGLRIRGLTTEL